MSRAGRSARPATIATTVAALSLVVAVAALGALSVGSTSLSLAELWNAAWGQGDPTHVAIVRQARIPSVALALLVGAYLGVGGAAMQGLLRNPLADPYILGISGGAAVGASVVIVGGWSAGLPVPALPIAAFAGALGAVALIYGVASVLPGGLRGPGATYTLLLTGVVFNALASALILLLHAVVTPYKAQELLLWLMGEIIPGRLHGAEWLMPIIVGGAGVAVLIYASPRLNLLALGDVDARALGVDPGRSRGLVFLGTALVVGAGVAYSGLIGFVGLIVPHAVRLAVGSDHRIVLPASAFAGAAFLVLADAVARASFPIADTVVPVGAITATLGAPLFFALLVRHLRGKTEVG